MSCGRKLGPFDCCSVVEGDCLELMKQLPDGCVDAVITDPPYGIGFVHGLILTKQRRPSNRRRIPERDVLRACTDLLTAHKIWWDRMNAGDQFGSYKGKGWRKRGHRPGTADILALPAVFQDAPVAVLTEPLWLECKATGKSQSAVQRAFQVDVEARGHTYLLVEDVDTLAAWLRERNL